MKSLSPSCMNIEKFGPENARDLYEDFTTDHLMLKALGSLLATSEMEHFCGDSEYSDGLRAGLGRIIEIYVEHQQRQLETLYFKATNCPEWIIERVEDMYNDLKGGKYGNQLGLKSTVENLLKVENVISQFGPEEYPKATKLRDELLRLQDYYSGKTTLKKAS